MSTLVTLDNVSLAFGLDVLLDHVKLQIAAGERVCLIGRNGAGKSSLLKIIEGVIAPDSGSIYRKPALRMAKLAQELPQDVSGTIFDFVAEGLAEAGALLKAYHAATHALTEHATEADMKKFEQLQHQLDITNGWQFEQQISTVLSTLGLDPEGNVNELSGGWQRRAALAQALVSSPELLLLDEPTNHLDIEAIQWLEDKLTNWNVGLVFITHDRSLLQRLATRIIELDRGQLTSWPGDYANFLRRKDEMLHAEAKLNADFDKKLVQEEKWIRQGVKARRTRNEGRVRALEAMRRERAERRERQGNVSFNIDDAQKSGKLVVEAENISQQYNDKWVIKNFSTRIMRGDRIGLIGPNGIGKSTLLKILLGEMPPQSGTVTIGTQLKVAYFDQLRSALNPEKSVAENVVQGSDTIEINDSKRHIISYLGDFLFTPERARTPVKALSGGECNRLLLARLFSQPANLLVLDEPTNDLDIETLELLEELLCNYKGTLLIVSHDRTFLDNVVTSTYIFEGDGRIQEYVGGYHDWLKQRKTMIQTYVNEKKSAHKVTEKKSDKSGSPSVKLSFKEQRELEQLPERIATLEKEHMELQQFTVSAAFYQQPGDTITKTMEKLKQLSIDLEQAYQRWAELEEKL